MRRQKRKKRDVHTPTRGQERPWLRVEYYLCAFSLAVMLIMTAGGLGELVYLAGTAGRNAAETEANEPEYVTFIRGVVNHLGGEDESREAEGDYEVDITQFADNTGAAGQLYALRNSYPEQVETILSHYENAALTVNGEETTLGEVDSDAIPERLVQLAVSNEETMDFVADYPTHHNDRSEATLDELKEGEIPLLLQWDERWGYEEYGSGLIAYTGCGPTCLAMVAASLRQDATLTPKAVADYADRAGYYAEGSGSTWTLMSEGCAYFGLTGTEFSPTEQKVAAHLEAGEPVICAVGAGDFTQSGHFIVLTGYQDGAFTLNDPNSRANSERTWTYEELQGQIKNLWYFTTDQSVTSDYEESSQ